MADWGKDALLVLIDEAFDEDLVLPMRDGVGDFDGSVQIELLAE